MAIDFDTYRQAATQALSSGYGASATDKMLGTPEHQFARNTKRDLLASTDPLMQAAVLDIQDWDKNTVDFGKMKSAGTAYMEWKKNLDSPMNFRAKNYAKQNNLDNFVAFKQMYDRQIAAYAPIVQNKLLNFQSSNYLSDSQMRDFISQNTGLQGVLRQAPQQVDAQGIPVAPPAWTMPQQTWGQTISRKTSDAMPGAGALIALRGAQAAYGIGTEGFGDWMARRSPFGKKSILTADPKSMTQFFADAPKRSAATRSSAAAQGSAQKAYNAAKKLYEKGNPNAMSDFHYNKKTNTIKYRPGKGNIKNKYLKNTINIKDVKMPKGGIGNQTQLNFKKTPKTPFEKTKRGKELLKNLDAAKSKNLKVKSELRGRPLEVVKKYIKKHGVGGMYKRVIKKVGVKGAAKLFTKRALGLALKGTGVGAAAGLALDAATLYQLYKIITTD